MDYHLHVNCSIYNITHYMLYRAFQEGLSKHPLMIMSLLSRAGFLRYSFAFRTLTFL
jgi:hypothetical protein